MWKIIIQEFPNDRSGYIESWIEYKFDRFNDFSSVSLSQSQSLLFFFLIQFLLFFLYRRNQLKLYKMKNKHNLRLTKNQQSMWDESGTKLMNGVKLQFLKGCGYNQAPNLSNSSYCLDDNRIIYILGKHILIYDALTEKQRIITSVDYVQEITSFKYFKNILHDDMILFARHSQNRNFPILTALNLNKNFHQQFVMAQLQKQQSVVNIQFVNQNKYIFVLSKLENSFRYSLIQFKTKNVIENQSLTFTPKGIALNKQYTEMLFLFSNKQIYIKQTTHKQDLKPLKLADYINNDQEQIMGLVCSVYHDLAFYIITNKGNLHFIRYNSVENCLIKQINTYYLGDYQTLTASGEKIITNKCPSAICCNEYNVLVGYYNLQQLTLFNINEAGYQNLINQSIKFSCPYLHKVTKLNFAYQTMACCMEVQTKINDKYGLNLTVDSEFLKQKGQQIMVKQNIANHLLPPGRCFPVVFNLLLYDTLVQTLRSPIQTVLNPMLITEPILDICIIPTKKLILILTATKIKAMKIDQISSTGFQRMLEWETAFNQIDTPTSVDTHPLTSVVAIGFKQGVKIFNISCQGLKNSNIHFSLKNCQAIRYSKFGHILAAGSSNQVILINPYQHIITKSFQINYGSNIKQMTFIDNDMHLFISCLNGSCQVINLQGKKIFQVWNKSLKTITTAYDKTYDIAIISYFEGLTKFYKNQGAYEMPTLRTYPFDITKILVCNELSTLFIGTSFGKVRCYRWPIVDFNKFIKQYTQISLHNSAITQMKLSQDMSMLITGAEDGSIFITKVSVYTEGMVLKPSQITADSTWKKIIGNPYYLDHYNFTSIGIQNEKQQVIVQLQSDKSDFQTLYSQVLENKQQQNHSLFSKQKQFLEKEMQSKLNLLQLQNKEINDKKMQLKTLLQQQEENFVQQRKMQESQKLDKMRSLYRQNDQLNQQCQYVKLKLQQQFQKEKQQYQNIFKQLDNTQNDKLLQLEAECKKQQQKLGKNMKEYQQLISLQEEEGSIYKTRMLEQLDTQLSNVHENGQQLRKSINKTNHSIRNILQKKKFLQMVLVQLDNQFVQAKQNKQNKILHLQTLNENLKEKDIQIYEEEQIVKELLMKNISNYSHQGYLKIRQEELQGKVKFLEKQIQNIHENCEKFQDIFISSTQKIKLANKSISQSIAKTQHHNTSLSQLKKKQYLTRYKNRQLFGQILEDFHNSQDKKLFLLKANQTFKQFQQKNAIESFSKQLINIQETASNSNGKLLQSRDMSTKTIQNSKKLRKIQTNISSCIAKKLNHQTTQILSQLNELRHEKKILCQKLHDLNDAIEGLKGNASIRIFQEIRENGSEIFKNKNRNSSILPFEKYQNKKKQRYSKIDESTRLPSLKHNQSSIYCENSSIIENILEKIQKP